MIALTPPEPHRFEKCELNDLQCGKCFFMKGAECHQL